MEKRLKVETVVNGPFVQNTFILVDSETMDAVIVDPGLDHELIAERAEALSVTVREILCTHAHIDHIAGAQPLKERFGVPLAIHEEERAWVEGMETQSQMFGIGKVEAPEVERWLQEGDTVMVGEVAGKVVHTPGHSSGGVTFQFGKILIVGDTLFAGSIGRTDLPGGSFRVIIESIKEKLFPAGDDAVVYSGHGPATNIGEERRYNPFLR